MHYEVGSAKQSTPQLSQLRAESAAKDAIGRWASTNVDNALVTFIEEAGEVLKTQQMLEVLQNLSIQTVNIGLRGVTFEERYTAPDGTVWVLASYPVKNLKDAYKQQAVELQQRMALAEAQAQAQVLQQKPCLHSLMHSLRKKSKSNQSIACFRAGRIFSWLYFLCPPVESCRYFAILSRGEPSK
jgi:hypothetical protein